MDNSQTPSVRPADSTFYASIKRKKGNVWLNQPCYEAFFKRFELVDLEFSLHEKAIVLRPFNFFYGPRGNVAFKIYPVHGNGILLYSSSEVRQIAMKTDPYGTYKPYCDFEKQCIRLQLNEKVKHG